MDNCEACESKVKEATEWMEPEAWSFFSYFLIDHSDHGWTTKPIISWLLNCWELIFYFASSSGCVWCFIIEKKNISIQIYIFSMPKESSSIPSARSAQKAKRAHTFPFDLVEISNFLLKFAACFQCDLNSKLQLQLFFLTCFSYSSSSKAAMYYVTQVSTCFPM